MAPLLHDPFEPIEPIDAFVASMPATYRESFDDVDVAAHLAIAGGRPIGETRVELWKELSDGGAAMCVVADDRPGLLSQINAALVAHEIDVISAHAYLRQREDGLVEAVDLLFLRRGADAGHLPVRPRDVMDIPAMIDALAGGRAAIGGASLKTLRHGGPSTDVRFDHDEQKGTTTLTVEATDRPGLLLVVTRTLFKAALQIVALRAATEKGRAVHRLELAEIDGTALRHDRLVALQTAILTAVDEGAVRDSVTREPVAAPVSIRPSADAALEGAPGRGDALEPAIGIDGEGLPDPRVQIGREIGSELVEARAVAAGRGVHDLDEAPAEGEAAAEGAEEEDAEPIRVGARIDRHRPLQERLRRDVVR